MMPKFLFILLMVIAGLVVLSSIGPLLSLAIGLVIVYFSLKEFLKTNAVFSKVIWLIFGLIGIKICFSSFPAAFGIIAIIFLYFAYKAWKDKVSSTSHE